MGWVRPIVGGTVDVPQHTISLYTDYKGFLPTDSFVGATIRANGYFFSPCHIKGLYKLQEVIEGVELPEGTHRFIQPATLFSEFHFEDYST